MRVLLRCCIEIHRITNTNTGGKNAKQKQKKNEQSGEKRAVDRIVFGSGLGVGS